MRLRIVLVGMLFIALFVAATGCGFSGGKSGGSPHVESPLTTESVESTDTGD